MPEYALCFVGGGPATLHYLSMTPHLHKWLNLGLAIVCPEQLGYGQSLNYNIHSNDQAKTFIEGVQPDFIKVLDFPWDTDLESSPMLGAVAWPMFRSIGEEVAKRVSASPKSKKIDDSVERIIMNKQGFTLQLATGSEIRSKVVCVNTGAGLADSIFSNEQLQILNGLAINVIHSDVFQRNAYADYIIKQHNFAIIGASHSAMSASKMIKRLNSKARIDFFYRSEPNRKNIANPYKAWFDEIFAGKVEGVSNHLIEDISALFPHLTQFDTVVEAVGYKRNIIPLYDEKNQKINSTQKPDMYGRIQDDIDNELKGFFGFGLMRPVHGLNPKTIAHHQRIVEGFGLLAETKIMDGCFSAILR